MRYKSVAMARSKSLQEAQRNVRARDRRRRAEEQTYEDALAQAELDVFNAGFEQVTDRSVKNRKDRRRELAEKLRATNEAKGIPYIKLADGRWRRACKGSNLYAEQCGLVPMKKGKILKLEGFEETCIATGDWCLLHDPNVTDSYLAEWRSRARGGKRRKLGPDEYLRKLITEHIGLFIRPHLDGLGIEMDHDTGEVKRIPGAGAKIYGESKDGDINMTDHDDVGAQAKLAESLFDRGFGRPRTQTELSITPTGGSATVPPTAERARDVAAVLAECNAIPTDTEEDDE